MLLTSSLVELLDPHWLDQVVVWVCNVCPISFFKSWAGDFVSFGPLEYPATSLCNAFTIYFFECTTSVSFCDGVQLLADIFSLGVIFITLVCIDGKRAFEYIYNHLSGSSFSLVNEFIIRVFFIRNYVLCKRGELL